jgi:hypothetical protein
MGRYFFHLHECGNVIHDEEGLELPDRADLREAAIREARSVMAAEVQAGRLCLSCRIEVTDEDQALIVGVPFKEALAITGL